MHIILIIVFIGGIIYYMIGDTDDSPSSAHSSVSTSQLKRLENKNDKQISEAIVDASINSEVVPVDVVPSIVTHSIDLHNWKVKFRRINKDNYKKYTAPFLYQLARGISLSEYNILKYKIYYMECMFSLGSPPPTDNYGTHIFDSCYAYDLSVNNFGYETWLEDIGKYQELLGTVKVLLEQYYDLSKRLDILHISRSELIRKYNSTDFTSQIDEDIKNISKIGLELTKTTKYFFDVIKPEMAKLDVSSSRQKALKGLKSLQNEMGIIDSLPSASLTDINVKVSEAVRKFEKAISE